MLFPPQVETGRNIVQRGSQLFEHIINQRPVPRRKLSQRGRSTMKTACSGHVSGLVRPARQSEVGGVGAGWLSIPGIEESGGRQRQVMGGGV